MVLHARAAAGGAGAPATYELVDHETDSASFMRHLTSEQRSLLTSCIMTARAEKNARDLITDLVSETPFKSAFWINREECTYLDWGYAALRASKEGLVTEDTVMDVTALACFVEEFAGSDTHGSSRRYTFKALLPEDEMYPVYLSHFFQAFGEAHHKEINNKIAELALHEKAIFAIYLPTPEAFSPLHLAIIETLCFRHCPRLHLSLPARGFSTDRSTEISFFLHPTFAIMRIALDILSTTTGLRQARFLPAFCSITTEEKAFYKASFTRLIQLSLPCFSPPRSAHTLPARRGTLLLSDEYLLITDRCIQPLHTYALHRLYAILQEAPAEMKAHPDFLAIYEKLINAERLSVHPRSGSKLSFFSLLDDPLLTTEQGRAILQLIYKDMAEQQEFWDAVLTAEDKAHKREEEISLLRAHFHPKKLSIRDLAYVLHILPETLVDIANILEGGDSAACLISFTKKLEFHIDTLTRRLFLFLETGDAKFFSRGKKLSAHTLAFLLSLSPESLASLKSYLARFPVPVEMIANLFHYFFNIEEKIKHYIKSATTLELPLRLALIPYDHPLLLKGHDRINSFLASYIDQALLPLPLDLDNYVFCEDDRTKVLIYIIEGKCHVISTMISRRRTLLQLFLNDLLKRNDISLQLKNPLSQTNENRRRLAFICEVLANASDEAFERLESWKTIVCLDLFNSLRKLV